MAGMLTDQETMQIFRDSGALLEGHFLLTSGLHSNQYFEKFQVLQYPEYTEKLCAEIARRFASDGVDVVVGPVTGGIILAYEVARRLGTRSIFTERDGDGMAFKRGFVIEPHERVLVVEDIVTTGKSVHEVLNAIEPTGAEVVGVGLLVDRSGGQGVDFGCRTEALLKVDVASWTADLCPMCAQGVPLTKRGSRKQISR